MCYSETSSYTSFAQTSILCDSGCEKDMIMSIDGDMIGFVFKGAKKHDGRLLLLRKLHSS